MRSIVSPLLRSVSVASSMSVLSLLAAPGCGGDEPIKDTPPNGSATEASSDTAEQSTADDATEDETLTTTPVGSSSSDLPTSDLPFGTAVGIECTEDSDCASPLSCVRTDDSFRGSLPGTGVCTMPCDTDDACVAVDQLAICDVIGAPTDEAIAAAGEGELPEGMARYCLQMCPFGAATEYKCDSLATFTCAPIQAGTFVVEDGTEIQLGACYPICGGDDDCDANEYCDTISGMCVESPRTGKALGERCDLASEALECAGGLCLGIAEELPYGVCSASCNIHPDTVVCDGEPGPDAEFVCFGSLVSEVPSSLNDVGQCLAMCDTDDDCPTAFACDLEIDVTSLGRSGLCWPTEESIANAVEELGSDAGAPITTEPPAEEDAGNQQSEAADGG